MVELNLDTIDGLDIHIALKLFIFAVFFVFFGLIVEFWRRKPFIGTYCLCFMLLAIPLGVYSGRNVTSTSKVIAVAIPFVLISVWRISCISDDIFNEHFSSYKLNQWVYSKLKGRISNKPGVMEWVLAILLFVNILWAVYVDTIAGSYFNAGCGLLLSVTIPLPSSIGRGFPGYAIQGDVKTAGEVVIDVHWLWVSIYTSWDFLLALMYNLNIWHTALHLLPCYLYCAVSRRWDLYLMVRTVNLYAVLCCMFPWDWMPLLLGQPVIVRSELVPIVLGSVHLFLAVCWSVYCVTFVWIPRFSSKAVTSKTQSISEEQIQKTQSISPVEEEGVCV